MMILIDSLLAELQYTVGNTSVESREYSTGN